MSNPAEYVFEREFNAPRSLVWKAWTNPELLARWYGPNIETKIHHFDLKPGGEWRNEMVMGEKSDHSVMKFQEVAPEEKIVWHHCSADKDWNVVSNPMMPNWPKVLHTTVTFEETGGKTKVTLVQVPMDATPEENETFAKMMRGMDNGWGSGYKIIDQILDELQNG